MKRWVCGRKWSGSPYCVIELEFIEKPKLLWIADRDAAEPVGLKFQKTIPKDDPRLCETREAAIDYALGTLTEELRKLARDQSAVQSQWESVLALK